MIGGNPMTRLKDSKDLWKLLLGQYVIWGILSLRNRIYIYIASSFSFSIGLYGISYALCLLVGLFFAALLNISHETLKSRLYLAVLVIQMLVLICPLFLWDYLQIYTVKDSFFTALLLMGAYLYLLCRIIGNRIAARRARKMKLDDIT